MTKYKQNKYKPSSSIGSKVKEYDVIIVGAGVSGTSLAHFLRNSKLKILWVEKRKNMKKMSNHRFGMNRDPIDKYKLQKIVIKRYNCLVLGRLDPKTWKGPVYNYYPFVVIDMNILARTLKFKGDIKSNREIIKAKRIAEGIEITDHKGDKYNAKIIVDCSGDKQIISKALKIKEKKKKYFFSNVSFELTNCRIPKEFQNKPSFPGTLENGMDLLWFYPYSATSCQLGNANFVYPGLKCKNNPKKSLLKYMKQEPTYRRWFKNAQITQEVEKLSALTITRPMIYDNLILCGEAAGATTPMTGEGSRSGIEMAHNASQMIKKAFSKKDYTAKTFKEYSDTYYRTIGKYLWSGRFMRNVVMRYMTEKELLQFYENSVNLKPKDYMKFLRAENDFFSMMKILKLDLGFGLLKNAIKYFITKKPANPGIKRV